MKRYCEPEPGMAWPVPTPETDGPRHDNFIWRLLWGEPSKSDLCLAASFIEAYENLVLQPATRRNKICKAVRAQMAANAEEDARQ